jgi:protein-tyrosine phosphatase
MDEVIPGLYVGSIADTYNKDIDVKICVLNENEVCPSGTVHIPILKMKDTMIDYLSKDNLDKIANIIDDALKSDKKVLVFCMAGLDRSPFAVAYFLMTKRNMMAHEAYNMIKQKRKIVNQHWDWFGMVR